MEQFCRFEPTKVALLLGEARITFEDIYTLAEEISNTLKGQFQAGDRILVSSKGVLSYVACMFAFEKLDLVFCCWNGETDKVVLANLVGARGFITTKNHGSFTLNQLNVGFPTTTVDIPCEGDLILTTSGSTGAPKGVLLQMRHVIENARLAGQAIGFFESSLQRWCIDIDFSLMSAISHMFMAWHGNLPLKSMHGLNGETISAEFKDGESGFGGAPLQLSIINQHLVNAPPGTLLVSSGDFLTRQTIDNITSKNPSISVATFYGLTELSGRFCYMSPSDTRKQPGATGRPLVANSLRIEEGKVIANSSFLFEGYFRQSTGFERLSDDFDTGDIGHFDDEGYMWLEGRANDTFKVSGIKVNRKEIERTLSESKIFQELDFIILPVSHTVMGTCCALFVAHASDTIKPSLREIISVIKTTHPTTHIPVYSYSVNTLPILKNGKVDKQYLIANHSSLERYR